MEGSDYDAVLISEFADRAALEQQLGKISWLPARAGFIAGITAPIEAGKVLSGGIQPASAWPIFE